MSFFFTMMFMFLVFWRPQEWLVPSLYGLPLLDAVVGAASLAFLAEYSARRATIPRGPVIFLFVGFFVAGLMSHIANTYWDGFVVAFMDMWKISFFCVLMFCVTDRPSRLRAIATVFIALTGVMVVHALMQQKYGYGFVHQPVMWKKNPYSGEVYSRSLFFGIFEDPNDLAQILATAIPFGFVLTKRGKLPGLLLGACTTAFLVSGILATHSRGGMMALVSAGAVMGILLLPRRWTLILMALMAIGALGLCPFAGPYLEDSSYGRVVVWGESNWAFKQKPLFGIGLRMLQEYVSDDKASHNAFVSVYTELGLFGYWFWFTPLVTGIVGSWRTRMALAQSDSAEGRYLSRFAGMAIAATVGFLASSYFLTRAYHFPVFFLMVILNAVPVIARPLIPEKSHPLILVGRDLFVYGTIGTLGSISYIYVSILLLNKAYHG